jgi:hypothetical protein
MNQTAALRAASQHVSVVGRGTSWTIISPWRFAEPTGPSTETHSDSYTKARIIARTAKAVIALHFMGLASQENIESIEYASYQFSGTARELLNAALAEIHKGAA